MAGLLTDLAGRHDAGPEHAVALAEFRAPGAFNAISRGASVVFVTDAPGVAERVAAWRDELAGRDAGARVEFEELTEPVAAYDAASSARVLAFLDSVPDGVFTMSSGLAGLVESSLNTGVVTQDGESLTVTLSTRSSDAEQHRELSGRLFALALAHGADLRVYGEYPAWQFNPDNPLLAHAVATYTELFGKPPTVTGVHGGLECGVLAGAYPRLPMLSVGAELTDCHTPRERADIGSIERLTALVVRIVETLP